MHETSHLLHKTPDGPVRLLNAGGFAAAQGEGNGLHQHTCWELVYYRTGHVGCPLGHEFFESQPGTLLVTPPSTVHGEIAWTAFSCFFIGLDAPMHLPWPHMCLDDTDGTFEHLCKALIGEWTGHHADRDEMLVLLLHQLDIVLRRSYEHPHLPHGERIVREAERLFRDRLATPLTIAAIAHEIGISPTALRGHFAHRRAQAPLARLNAMRVEHAVTLLRTSNMTLEAIARLCGYDSASHLSRHVKRATGRSPGAIRTN